MQAEPDSNSHLNNKGDVDGINFRPSSNFKHMRKYRKGAVAGGSSGGETSGARSEEDSSGECQPPLPRDPPPPDSPLLTLKTEVQDEDYQESDEPSAPDDLPQDSSNSKRTMCRDFARGACPYGDKCRFAHEIIVSQLPGIYTFCKDFQNSICKYQGQCKFVHATVFEKEFYFRTGYLPPHAIAHMQRADVPETGAPSTEGGQVEATVVYHNPPPPRGSVVHPGVSGMAAGGAEARPSSVAVATTVAIPTFAREWRDMDELGAGAARDAVRPPVPRKCGHCDINMYRLQCAKNKLEKAMRSSQELNKKRATLEVKIAKQKLFLRAVMGEPAPPPPPPPSTSKAANLFSSGNFRNPEKTSIMEKLALLLANNDHTPAVEEPSKTSIMEKLALLLANNDHMPAVEEPSKTLDQRMILRWLSGESSTPPRHPPGPEPGPPPAR